jgi:hypothetical protein
MTNNGAMCNPRGQLGVEEFEVVMREQILNYTQSRLSATSEFWNVSDQDFTELGTLKQLLMEQLSIKKELEATKRSLNGVLDLMQSARKHSDGCECAVSYHIRRRSRSRMVRPVRRTTSGTTRVSQSRDVCKEISGKMDLLRTEIFDILESVGLTENESVGTCEEDNSIGPHDGSVSLHSSYGGSDGIYKGNPIAVHIVSFGQRETVSSSSRQLASNKALGVYKPSDQRMASRTRKNGLFVSQREESTSHSSAEGLSGAVKASSGMKSLCVELDFGMKNCAKQISPYSSCSSRKQSHTSSLNSQTHTSSSSCESQHDEHPLYPQANPKGNFAGIAQNMEHKYKNSSSIENGNALQPGISKFQRDCDEFAAANEIESSPTSHDNVKFSSRSISGTRSCSFSFEFCENTAFTKDPNQDVVLDLGTSFCQFDDKGDTHPKAIDIFSDVATGLSDCVESDMIMLSGCA